MLDDIGFNDLYNTQKLPNHTIAVATLYIFIKKEFIYYEYIC